MAIYVQLHGYRSGWLPGGVRKALHWTQGPVFKHLLHNLIIKGEAQGVRLALEKHTQAASNLARNTSQKQAVRSQAPHPLLVQLHVC